MNILWPSLIIISFIYALFSGNIERVNNSIYESLSDSVTLVISLIGNMCLWCGIMNIVKNTRIIEILRKVLRPILSRLFKDVSNNEMIMDYISLNVISNMLGIGNSATPAGLKAMEEMQKENKKRKQLTNSMATLIVLNTASIQLVPTTVIAIRSTFNSRNPSEIVKPIWISTMIGSVIAIILIKIVLKMERTRK